ncbi:carboxypeptidase-like regulatory domain-containing protein [Daejeonella sp.]|uniref:carboxypeptidase-like regulatory domain-containing protein n=1 Tax=Daejeonella sp. TaxID=2805397 RepID=UPI0030BEC025
MPRAFCILIFITLTGQLQGQTFRARVLDLVTKEAISGATVKGKSSTLTDAEGNFSLTNVKAGDTLRIIHLGYRTYVFTFNALHPGFAFGKPPEISLQRNSILLNEVFVSSFRDSRADSIKNREDFATEFAYKAPSFKDIFVLKSPEESMARHVDVHRGNNPYSASNLMKIDVLQMVSFLSKNKTAPSKLQKALLQDEGDKYIDRLFSKEAVIALTKLKGDSLKNFMIQYRPTLAVARSKTEYEMIAYIRTRYLEFIK